MTPEPIFSNRIAAFTWGFTAVWLGMLGIFTWLMITQGSPDQLPGWAAWGILALFWLFGAGLARYALSQPCQFLTVRPPGRVEVTWRYPHKAVRAEHASGDLDPPDVIESRDTDGDPYFHARLALPDGRVIDLAEGHDRGRCEEACARFRDAIARAGA